MAAKLYTWTIYYQPADYPHCYVVRRFTITLFGARAGPEVVLADDLAEARRAIPRGCVNKGRATEDHPTVVETWV